MTAALLTALFVLTSCAALVMGSASLLRHLRTGSSSDLFTMSLVVGTLSSLWGVVLLGEDLDTGDPLVWSIHLLPAGAVFRTVYVHRAGTEAPPTGDRTAMLLALSGMAATAVAFGGAAPMAILPSIASGLALVSTGAAIAVTIQERNCWAAGATALGVMATLSVFLSFNVRLIGAFYNGTEPRSDIADLAYIPLGIATLLACDAGVRRSGRRLLVAAVLLAGAILLYLALI